MENGMDVSVCELHDGWLMLTDSAPNAMMGITHIYILSCTHSIEHTQV